MNVGREVVGGDVEADTLGLRPFGQERAGIAAQGAATFVSGTAHSITVNVGCHGMLQPDHDLTRARGRFVRGASCN